MMKKIISLLLMLLLLTSSAFAEEAYQAEVRLQVSQAALKDYLLLNGQEDGSRLDGLVEGIAQLADGFALNATVQETGCMLALLLGNTPLLDFSVYSQGNNDACLYGSLLPGHYLNAPISHADAEASAAAQAVLDNLDWAAFAADLQVAFDAWNAGITQTSESGSFMGDTYEGGVLRTTYSFDDSDLAALLSSVLSAVEKQGITDEMLSALIDEDGVLAAFKAKNASVAEENRYRYLMHFVKNAYAENIGTSIVAMEGNQQVMTISLATASNGVRVVWGYGLNEENYYIDAVLIDDGTTGNELAVAYSLTVYRDAMRQGYRAVEPYIDYVEVMYTGTARVVYGDDATTWQVNAEVASPAAPSDNMRYVFSGEHQGDDAEMTISITSLAKENAQPFATATLHISACEPVAWSTEGLARLPDDDTALMDELIESAATDLVVKLFKLIPPQVLTLLMF